MSLIIKKILNNSAAIAFDSNRNDYLVMGKGIVFGKIQYDELDETLATQVIYLNKENKSKYEALISEIPIEYFAISEKIKILAEKELKTTLDSDILIKLTDHIYNAQQRLKKGIKTPNLILNEIKIFYPSEYKISEIAVSLANKELNTQFDENEVGFITFHIVNSESKNGVVDLNETIEFISNVTAKINEYFNIDLGKNPIAYSRLITHLKYFSISLFSKEEVINREFDDNVLYETLKDKYKDIDLFLEKLSSYIEKQYKYVLTDQDKMYLLIHLARILK